MATLTTEIARVRALTNATASDFTDDDIETAVLLYPTFDIEGYAPGDEDYTTTYDCYRAAADIVEQWSARVALHYDVNADGANLSRSQMQAQLTSLASRLLSKAKPRICNLNVEREYECSPYTLLCGCNDDVQEGTGCDL